MFNETIDGKEKVELLKSRYGLKTTIEFEKEVSNMTAYTARLINEGMEKGRQEGQNEKSIIVYHNLRARGFSREDAISIAAIDPENNLLT